MKPVPRDEVVHESDSEDVVKKCVASALRDMDVVERVCESMGAGLMLRNVRD